MLPHRSSVFMAFLLMVEPLIVEALTAISSTTISAETVGAVADVGALAVNYLQSDGLIGEATIFPTQTQAWKDLVEFGSEIKSVAGPTAQAIKKGREIGDKIYTAVEQNSHPYYGTSEPQEEPTPRTINGRR